MTNTIHYDENALLKLSQIIRGIPASKDSPYIPPLLKMSRNTFLKLVNEGKLAKPEMIGNNKFWRYKDLMKVSK
jgi:hypothetical protein